MNNNVPKIISRWLILIPALIFLIYWLFLRDDTNQTLFSRDYLLLSFFSIIFCIFYAIALILEIVKGENNIVLRVSIILYLLLVLAYNTQHEITRMIDQKNGCFRYVRIFNESEQVICGQSENLKYLKNELGPPGVIRIY